MLEFGCELLSEKPEAAAAAAEDAPESALLPVLVLPEEADADAGAAAAARGTRRRVRARAGGQPAPGQRRPASRC